MQNFIVLQVTRNAEGNISVTPSAKETEDAAYSKYYDILKTAATSQAPVHGAMLLTYDLFEIEHKVFKHEAPEPTPEPEQPTE